jgi:alpha-tubulin suppressor-like RCC1 family protein
LTLAACGGGDGSVSGAAQGQPDRLLVGPTLSAPQSLDDNLRIVAGADFVLGLATDGQVYSWGNNDYGQLGQGLAIAAHGDPLPVHGMSAVQAVAAGGYHAAALRTDGSVWAWGNNNYGQLGIGFVHVGFSIPRPVPGLSGVKAISAGYIHTAALSSKGEVWGWGQTPAKADVKPALVLGLSHVRSIAAGSDFNLALKEDGTVWSWGGNRAGQLGLGQRGLYQTTPARVAALTDVVAVSAGYLHGLALRSDGTVWAWGSNAYDQLGTGTYPQGPVAIPGLPATPNGAKDVKGIVAGAYNSAVVYRNGEVWAWGSNLSGQLSDATVQSASAPRRIATLAPAAAVSIGDDFLVVLQPDGTLVAMGSNRKGQLGNGTTLDSAMPSPVRQAGGDKLFNLGPSKQ